MYRFSGQKSVLALILAIISFYNRPAEIASSKQLKIFTKILIVAPALNRKPINATLHFPQVTIEAVLNPNKQPRTHLLRIQSKQV